MNNLTEEIRTLIRQPIYANSHSPMKWLNRLEQGALTRDENPHSHFCVYFLPFNPETEKLFIIHHKKSGLWLAPGGHIDKEENLFRTLSREVMEELGLNNIHTGYRTVEIFLLTITPINHSIQRQTCQEHFDIWYRFPADGSDFQVDPREFHSTLWVTIAEARKLVTDPANLQAIALMEKLFTT